VKTIYITGHSGFVGKNLIDEFKSQFIFTKHVKGNDFLINEEIVIHLAGKAHDLKKVADDKEYYEVNTELTKNVFNSFMKSDAKVFIFLSSVKAVADFSNEPLTEDVIPNPITHYGKSKLLAEEYISSFKLPDNKRVFILRPCMIHGANNKGNLNLLFKVVSFRIPWPLGAFNNQRSFCSVHNLIGIIKKIILIDSIPSGIYNVSDTGYISTNRLVEIISLSLNRKPLILKIPKSIVKTLAKIGSIFSLPFNEERLEKLTENYMVSNKKLLEFIDSDLPFSIEYGLENTLRTFIASSN
jgi:nucleoside-diphosphate-sugar epimerase